MPNFPITQAVEIALNMAQKGADRINPTFDLDSVERVHGRYLSDAQKQAAREYWSALIALHVTALPDQ